MNDELKRLREFPLRIIDELEHALICNIEDRFDSADIDKYTKETKLQMDLYRSQWQLIVDRHSQE